MAKTATMVTIDEDLKKQAKSLQINISGALNEYLETLVNRHNQDVGGINIELERRKLSKLQKQQGDLQASVNECLSIITVWEEKREQEQENRLKKEKELIEAQSKCTNCGNMIVSKVFNLGKDRLCKACYMTK